jgi:tetratricopeptide (TPR) repeat protein
MDNTLVLKFNKSLRLLDKGKTDDAKKLLEEIIEISKVENNKIFYIKATTVIGELFFNNGKIIEAKYYFEKALETKLEDDNDDVADYEKQICTELLNEIIELEKNGAREHGL